MNKLFVFQEKTKDYFTELEQAYKKVSNDNNRIDLSSLNIEYLIEHKFDVVISNGLPKEWYFILKGLNIVTITIDNRKAYDEYADIIIDCMSDDDIRYFVGKKYSFCNKRYDESFDMENVFDLVKKLEWDSSFFGYNVAYLSCMHLTDNIFHKVSKYVKDEKIRLLEYLCNCHDRNSVLVAEKNGFSFADVRLTFEKKIANKEEYALNDFLFAKATSKDIPILQKKISEDFYKDSRHYFDGNFDVTRVNNFFQVWIEQAVLGKYDDECFCLYQKDDPIAYCTLKYNNSKSANIGLLGVDKKYYGKEFGKRLLKEINNFLIKRNISNLFVVTQGRNYSAQRLYQKSGFKTKTVQLWYHKWFY